MYSNGLMLAQHILTNDACQLNITGILYNYILNIIVWLPIVIKSFLLVIHKTNNLI